MIVVKTAESACDQEVVMEGIRNNRAGTSVPSGCRYSDVSRARFSVGRRALVQGRQFYYQQKGRLFPKGLFVIVDTMGIRTSHPLNE
jgi:hypothetical protein